MTTVDRAGFSWGVSEPDGFMMAIFATRRDADDYCEYLATIGIAAAVRELPEPNDEADDEIWQDAWEDGAIAGAD